MSEQCQRKLRYLTKREAKRRLRILIQKGKADKQVSAYRCPTCNFYHLGHSRRKA